MWYCSKREHKGCSKLEQEKKLTAAQIRAARALLNMSQAKLADLAGLSAMTVKRAEGSGKPKPSDEVYGEIRKTLELSGVEFLNSNGKGAGVRFSRSE